MSRAEETRASSIGIEDVDVRSFLLRISFSIFGEGSRDQSLLTLRWVPLFAKSISLQNQKARKVEQNDCQHRDEKLGAPVGVVCLPGTPEWDPYRRTGLQVLRARILPRTNQYT